MNLPTGLLLCTADGAVLAGDDASRRLLAAHGPLRGDGAGAPRRARRTDGVHIDTAPVAWGERPCLLVKTSSSACEEGIERSAARAIVMRALLEGLVHDLRSPLNSIAMNAEMLRFSRDSAISEASRDQRQDRYVAAITNESSRLGGAVAALVDLVEGADIAPGDDALARLCAAVERLGLPALRMRQVELQVETPAPAPALAHTGDLVLALLALLLGVAEHAGPGATLVLSGSAAQDAITLEMSLDTSAAPGAGGAGRLDAAERATLLLVAARIVNAADGRLGLDAADALSVVLPAAA
ncbi:MAG: histidine kinase dimerization/phospho-acceptor domain-containing protein [Gammaproteobacteria bacterium]